MTSRLSSSKTTVLVNAALFLLVMAVSTLILSKSVVECLWGHLRSGLDFIAAGHVLLKDPYSYTSDRPWIDHEWLFEVILAQAYKSFGLLGISFLKVAVADCIIACLLTKFLSSKLAPIYASILTIVSLVALLPSLSAPRPQLLSILFFILVLLALSTADKGNRKPFYLLPVLFVLWCNIHGGFVAGLGAVGAWVVVDSICSLRQNLTRVDCRTHILANCVVFVACAAAVLINPYGLALPLMLFQTLSMPRPEFADWNPINILQPVGMTYVCFLVATACAFFYSKLRKPPPSTVVLAVVAIQPLVALRHLPFALVAMLIFGAEHLSAVINARAPGSGSLVSFPPAQKVLLSLLCCAASVILLARSVPNLSLIPIEDTLPIRAVSLLKNSHSTGNLALMFDWGDYCIWHLSPEIKVSTDWRRETVYSPYQQALNLKLTYGLGNWDELMTKFPTDFVLASKNYATFDLLQLSPQWQLCYQDQLCGLFAKRGTDSARKLLQAKPDTQVPTRFP